MVDKVIEKVLESTSSGLKGEGKIFVSNIDEVVDIGTRKRGETVL